jgi:uncharacterized protein (TIGR02145 family)
MNPFKGIEPVWYLASGIILINFVYIKLNYGYYIYYLFIVLISAGYLSRKKIDSYIVKKEWFLLKSKPVRYLAFISLLFTLFYYIYVFSYHFPYLGNFVYGPRDVHIANQVWMDRNLDVSTFMNGEPIFEAENEEEWNNACDKGQPAWCYFDFKAENGRIYGKLYNQFALYDKRGIAPEGYRIPKTSDIWDLIKNLGGITSADKALKSKDDWIYFSYRGDNSSGFNAIPTSEGYASWWNLSGYFYLNDDTQAVNFRDYEDVDIYEKHSVRCLKGYEKKLKTNLQTINIGTQIWTSKNLEVSTYLNGEPIRHARTQEEWENAGREGIGVWCYYNHDPKKGELYGKLYNWYAINDKRGLAPEGYHIPSDAEWSILINYLGGGDSTGFKMKSTTGWNSDWSIDNGNGDNSSGFNAFPGGGEGYDNTYHGAYGNWWSSTEVDARKAWRYSLSYSDSNVSRDYQYKTNGYSVRCLKD